MNEMNESDFRQILQTKLHEGLKDCEVNVKSNINLIYKVIINKKFKFEPETPESPRRGHFAFQTDLLITSSKEDELPLVVIETKYPSFSTHDVMTYSIKAQKHKEIYPYLRYGLVVGKQNKIHNRFFVHNHGFDFAYALNNFDRNSIKELVQLVKQQINNANLLLDILKKKNQIKMFNTTIEIK